MSHKEDLRKTYNKIADDWHKDFSDDTWWIKGVNQFIKLIKKGGSVLDVGCGSGLKSKYLISKGFDVTGIDISDKMIEIARKNYPKGHFSAMDMEKIKLDQKFDGVMAHACLLHAKKNKAAEIVKHWTSFVKPKGYLYIATKELVEGVNEKIIKEGNYGYEYERFFSYYTQKEIEKYMKDAGLEIVHSVRRTYGTSKWLRVIGRKK